MSGATMRYDGDLDRHYHIRCVGCGKINDVHIPGLDFDTAKPGSIDGYEVLGHRLEFIGLCKSCRKQQGLEGTQ